MPEFWRWRYLWGWFLVLAYHVEVDLFFTLEKPWDGVEGDAGWGGRMCLLPPFPSPTHPCLLGPYSSSSSLPWACPRGHLGGTQSACVSSPCDPPVVLPNSRHLPVRDSFYSWAPRNSLKRKKCLLSWEFNQPRSAQWILHLLESQFPENILTWKSYWLLQNQYPPDQRPQRSHNFANITQIGWRMK